MHRQNPPDYETRPLFHRARDLKGIYNEMAPIPMSDHGLTGAQPAVYGEDGATDIACP